MKGDNPEDTLNQMDSDFCALQNIVKILHRAALWSQKNTDLDNLDWVFAMDILNEAAQRVELGAGKLTDLITKSKDERQLASCTHIRREIAQFKDLISIFNLACIGDAESGDPQLKWAIGFETLFNMMDEIEKSITTAWDACFPKSSIPDPSLVHPAGQWAEKASCQCNIL